MQTTINNNLEERIVALEATVMQLQQQLIALMPVVIVPEPETEVEPVSDVSVLMPSFLSGGCGAFQHVCYSQSKFKTSVQCVVLNFDK